MGVFQGEGAVMENAALLRGHPHEFCFTPPFGARPTTQTTGQGANTQQTHPHLGMRGKSATVQIDEIWEAYTTPWDNRNATRRHARAKALKQN